MVDDDRELGEGTCKLRYVHEVPRPDGGKLEHQPALLDEPEALENVRPNDPVSVGLIVDLVANATQLRLSGETFEP